MVLDDLSLLQVKIFSLPFDRTCSLQYILLLNWDPVYQYYFSDWICCRELSFDQGDVIDLIRPIDKNWFEATHNGAVGFVPTNYIKASICLF